MTQYGAKTCAASPQMADSGFPGQALIKFQTHEDGTGFCHWAGDLTQAVFDVRAPALNDTAYEV